MFSPAAVQDVVAIVTGSGRGVGRGITAALLERGARVLATDVDAAGLTRLQTDMGQCADRLAVLTQDLRAPDAAPRIVDAAIDRFGTVNGLVNNAVAGVGPTPFTELTDEDFQLTFDTGPRVTFALMKQVHPHLVAAGGGSIVNLGSGAGTGGTAYRGVYAGAKEAIRGLSKVAAIEWGKDNIRVNVICPFANSEAVTEWQSVQPDAFNAVMAGIPIPRVGDTKDDIGALVAFLLGPESTYITCQTIQIDGGSGCYR